MENPDAGTAGATSAEPQEASDADQAHGGLTESLK